MSKKWIQSAIKKPGALTSKAKRAGMSISKYCAKGDLDETTKRQCALAKTLKKLRK